MSIVQTCKLLTSCESHASNLKMVHLRCIHTLCGLVVPDKFRPPSFLDIIFIKLLNCHFVLWLDSDGHQFQLGQSYTVDHCQWCWSKCQWFYEHRSVHEVRWKVMNRIPRPIRCTWQLHTCMWYSFWYMYQELWGVSCVLSNLLQASVDTLARRLCKKSWPYLCILWWTSRCSDGQSARAEKSEEWKMQQTRESSSSNLEALRLMNRLAGRFWVESG